MKKVSYFLMAALLVAANCVFVSCGEDNAAPTITVNLNKTDQNSITVENDETVTVKIDFEAAGGIDQIEIDKIDNDGSGSNVTGFPKKSGFVSKTTDKITLPDVTFSGKDGGTIKFNVKITDKSKTPQSTTQLITINFKKDGGPIVVDEFETSAAYEIGFNANNAFGSFFSVSNKQVLKVADATSAQASVDFVFFYGSTNKGTVAAPNDSDVPSMFSAVTNWSTKNATKFKKVAGADASNPIAWWNDNINTASASKANNLAVNDVIIFQTAGGTKGAFVVAKIGTVSSGTIEIKLISKK